MIIYYYYASIASHFSSIKRKMSFMLCSEPAPPAEKCVQRVANKSTAMRHKEENYLSN